MKYQLSIETLTPLHISSGSELIARYDYLSSSGMTYILNQDEIYAAEFERNAASARLHDPAGLLIRPDDLRSDSRFVDYTLQNATRLERLREQIKDYQRRCYLPGSSMKGAIRTGLAAFALEAGMYRPTASGLGDKPKEAAQQIERELFGKDPNHSIFRALEIADSKPLPRQPSCLQLCPVSVFSGSKADSPIAVEAVMKKTEFSTVMTIDELSLRYRDELDWQKKALLLVDLSRLLQAVSIKRILSGKNWALRAGMNAVAEFYDSLLKVAGAIKGKRAFLLQMGWGTGWEGTTVGLALPTDVINEARKRFKLGKPPKAHADSWEPVLTHVFPKTRRLQVQGEQTPVQPLGWVMVVMTPISEPQFAEDWKKLRSEARSLFAPAVERLLNPEAPTTRLVSIATDDQLPIQPNKTALDTAVVPPDPKPASPSRTVVTPRFSALPKVGQRFPGEVISVESNGCFVEVPGLDPDSLAIGWITDPQPRPREGTRLICEVIELRPDPYQKGLTLVICQTV